MSRNPVVDLTEADATGADGAQREAGSEPVVIETAESGKASLPDRAEMLPDGTVRLKLSRVVALTIKAANGMTREETFSELVFRELNGSDMRALLQAPPERQPVIGFSRSTGINIAIMTALFDKMSVRDINAASACISFLAE